MNELTYTQRQMRTVPGLQFPHLRNKNNLDLYRANLELIHPHPFGKVGMLACILLGNVLAFALAGV